MADVQGAVDDLLRVQHDQECKAILEWITPIDYAPQHNDYIRRRQKGTGQWLLDSAEFQTWLKTGKQTLFCPGIPGAGKTIMSSIVINHLKTTFQNNPTIGIAYLYFNFRRQHDQRLDDLLLCLLKQLVQEQSTIPDCVRMLYDCHKNKQARPLSEEISTTLQAVAGLYSRVFVIVDALDECQTIGGCRVKFLLEIFSLQAKTGANLFTTSRIDDETAKLFDSGLSLEIRASGEDTEKYLNSQMSFLQPDILDDDIRDLIRREIVQAIDGILKVGRRFLLAELFINTLASLPTKGDIKHALQNLRKGIDGLDRTYEQAMERIEGQGRGQRELAKRTLSWIIHARAPLSTVELRHALAVKPGTTKLDEDYLPGINVLRSICVGLITVDEESDVIRLVHYTAQEFFKRTQRRWFPEAEVNIAHVCITYLSFDAFASGFCQSDEEFEKRLQSNPLYDYAARNWGHHVRESDARRLDEEFFENEAKVSASSQALMVGKEYRYSGYSQHAPRNMRGIHLAAWFGLAEMVDRLANRHFLDCKDSRGKTPLSYGAERGHEVVVKLLLKKGAELESEDDWFGRTPLSFAAVFGQEAVVKLLLEKGAELESRDGSGWTPLTWAARMGHGAAVEPLLEKGAKLESMSAFGRTPLLWAVENGRETVVELLLEKGAELESKDDYGRTPLSCAIEKGHETVVEMLLEKGAELESRDGDDWTPLLYAVVDGHQAIVKLLLEKGAELECKDKSGRTPVSYAAEEGDEMVVKLLLEKGVVLECKDISGRTPLSWAAERGREAVVRLLLEKGAELECKDKSGRTPLLYATGTGHKMVVELLLEKGARLECRDISGRTPLSWAAENGHIGIVDLLVRYRDEGFSDVEGRSSPRSGVA
ncbi:hypothetical protein GP486_005273 [Trichoglossum hirsutum]|uniref:NACHT domain-containing protein n=1 Tax=Trichoglossum hirsutum TaxID=265104 RepID=A0A9P8L9K2_9PEZI|nr:hypothetical protein GP486_005273 [Trichoglossum hirsutum]